MKQNNTNNIILPENEYQGRLLGSIEEVYGSNSIIEIKETELNNRNIKLTINNGENDILCSASLSTKIKENNVYENPSELLRYSVHEFPNNIRYVVNIMESNMLYEKEKRLMEVKEEFMDFFEEYLLKIKDITLSPKERIEADEMYKEKELKKSLAIEKINKDYENLL